MAILPIRTYPDPVLKQRALPVDRMDAPEIQQLIDDMLETMYAAPGVGLAAPQVGVPLQLFVIDISSREENEPVLVLANPEVIQEEGSVQEEEGCLSVPETVIEVKRAKRICVKGINREGKEILIEGEGLLARAIQHEIDHLNGILLFDRVSPLMRDLLKRKIKKALKVGR